jgi:hypothetical protein
LLIVSSGWQFLTKRRFSRQLGMQLGTACSSSSGSSLNPRFANDSLKISK